MTQNFIYAYTAIPENLNDNGMALPDWQDLPEINRVLMVRIDSMVTMQEMANIART